LIVGLGNPGPQYQATRHNVGFHVVDRLLSRWSVSRSLRKFHADVFEVRLEGGPLVTLLRPLTYMNLSGRSVAGAVSYWELPLESLLLVCDDFNLPLGRLRVRRSGSAGGQKGLADTISRLGTNEFARLRIGIAAPTGDPIDHVLGTFAPDERPVIGEAVDRAADAIELWLRSGIDEVMNRYNAG